MIFSFVLSTRNSVDGLLVRINDILYKFVIEMKLYSRSEELIIPLDAVASFPKSDMCSTPFGFLKGLFEIRVARYIIS